MGNARTVVGYTVIGPMESVYTDDAPTPEDARKMYEEKRRWVADVYEVYEGEMAALDEVRCVVCDKLLAG